VSSHPVPRQSSFVTPTRLNHVNRSLLTRVSSHDAQGGNSVATMWPLPTSASDSPNGELTRLGPFGSPRGIPRVPSLQSSASDSGASSNVSAIASMRTTLRGAPALASPRGTFALAGVEDPLASHRSTAGSISSVASVSSERFARRGTTAAQQDLADVGLKVRAHGNCRHLVVGMEVGGAAEESRNVMMHDIIASINDAQISHLTPPEVQRLLAGPEGSQVTLCLLRGGPSAAARGTYAAKPSQHRVTLTRAPRSSSRPRLTHQDLALSSARGTTASRLDAAAERIDTVGMLTSFMEVVCVLQCLSHKHPRDRRLLISDMSSLHTSPICVDDTNTSLPRLRYSHPPPRCLPRRQFRR
jgi:hypothetical protein